MKRKSRQKQKPLPELNKDVLRHIGEFTSDVNFHNVIKTDYITVINNHPSGLTIVKVFSKPEILRRKIFDIIFEEEEVSEYDDSVVKFSTSKINKKTVYLVYTDTDNLWEYMENKLPFEIITEF